MDTSTITTSSSPLLSNSLSTSSSYATVFSAKPSSSIIAPSTPSNYLLHSPPYYVAIVLGTVAGIAFLASLTAWAIRRQAHERHRRLADSAAKMPWASSGGGNGDHNDGFGNNSIASDIENAMHTTPTEMGIMNLGSREDMAYVQSWEPRGDRDVGEPKRCELYEDDSKWKPPFINQQIPSYTLFSRYSGHINDVGSSRANRASLGSIDPHVQAETLGQGSALLITNQVPGDISASSSQEAGLPCLDSPLSEVGTPRELIPMPRFLGLDGKGLSVPWQEQDPLTKPKSRIMSAEHIRRTWERQTSDEPEREGWANSIKSNFVNIFNSVTATLPIATIKDGKETTGSNFTPARPKRSSKRNVQGPSSYSEDEAKPQPILSRGCSIKASMSDPWSLVKTGSNIGIVRIHLPTSDVCSVSSHDLSDPGFGLSRSYTLHDPKPLQVEKKAPTPLFKGCLSISSKGSTKLVPFSRTLNTGGSVSPKRYRQSPGCSIKRKITSDRRSVPLFSRTTSMASSSSTVSIVTGAEDIREKRILAREALKDRRRKAKRLKETPIG